ncbi:Pycsar system effector family protein [Gaoshiqia sediminis]|uniref:DUF5706 domain-containing protein n=1 Tax=Gaoshiqia sediminis TaxID=2986998 RepID=A0AA41Y719_9BACT|nr:Pycsar system effector family protein [Gaoshiqia sediminis]MCW0484604.1 DUF5706 domain-containing protein [Gaoshiqia sediminis]
MDIVDRAKLFVIDFFENHHDRKLVFHTLGHTMTVVKQAALIGENEQLSDTELQAVLVAAWFHDTGYLILQENHEDASINIAQSFFEKNAVPEDFARHVVQCIEATRRETVPETLAEKVILDADISHVGHENFISISKKLRKERSLCQDCTIPQKDYWQETLEFLQGLRFYTQFAVDHFHPVKEQNVEKVKKILADLLEKANKSTTDSRERSTAKGIESMFRLTANNQMRLTSIADKKANILISINSILISVSAAVASRHPFFEGELVPAVVVLFVSSLASLVFAILSCRPKLSSKKYGEADLKERNVNLLFFGNFHQIPYQQYDSAMKEMMDDYDYLYTNLIKDQYYLGQSLFRKFKLLRTAYNIFMFGFVLAAVVFVFSYFMNA